MSNDSNIPRFALFELGYRLATIGFLLTMVLVNVWLIGQVLSKTKSGVARTTEVRVAAGLRAAPGSAGSEQVDPAIQAGAKVYQGAAGCHGCHGIPGETQASLGPSLEGIATRALERVEAADYKGEAVTAAEYIRESILSPRAYTVPDCPTGACGPDVMPADIATKLSPTDLDNLIAYLLAQK
jgi:mono/diheme cytochrome c family protein